MDCVLELRFKRLASRFFGFTDYLIITEVVTLQAGLG